MISNKLETISNLFEGKEIRSVWDSEREEYCFSVVDVIGALTDSKEPRKYWSVLKNRLKKEGSEVTTNCSQLKMLAPDGKTRLRDVMITKDILRLIESVPSPKAEPFKLWLANLGSERIDEVFNPELAVNRAVEYYRNKGYTDEWIKARLIEYALLTNEIYKGWSGMKASEYKEYKGIRKESLRDNMTDIEVALTNIGEIAARDIAIEEKPQGLKENMKVAKRGGSVAKGARDLYEKETKRKAISDKNTLNYKYIDDVKEIEDNQ